jgi:tRNA(fMet)-specific endonuclease VapC
MAKEIICVDTSVLIEYFRKKDKEQTYFYRLSGLPVSFAVTSITSFEIYRGANQTQLKFWDELFNQMRILPFDDESARIAALLTKQVPGIDKSILLPDLFIASIALSHEIRIATLNLRDFQRIPDLKIIMT